MLAVFFSILLVPAEEGGDPWYGRKHCGTLARIIHESS